MHKHDEGTDVRNDLPPSAGKKVRIGVIVPETLDKNLEAFCLKAGISKQEALRTALHQFLQKKGMDPDKLPKLTFSY